METAFKNKVAIITGGSSGIGRATALASPKKEQNCYCIGMKARKLCRVLQT
jgi:NAD(P)-dependent dehydrogenase (short-subunit alcohol dehydrogenase family)